MGGVNYEGFINGLIDIWERDNINLAHGDMKHHSVKIIEEIDSKISIPIILKRIKEKTTLFFMILWRIVPENQRPSFPSDTQGKIKEMTQIWVEWGEDNNYLKKE